MTEHHEKLSAIIDGDNLTDEFIDQLKQDPSLSETWGRYHLIGDVMRNETGDKIDLDFSAKMAQALEDEPAILAPVVENNWQRRFAGVKGGVVSLFHQGGQFAIAATVTAAVIFGVQQYNVGEQNQPNTDLNAPVLPVGINTGVSPVSLESTRPVSQQELLLQQRRKVNAYVLDHQQQLRLQATNAEDKNQAKQADETAEK